MEKKLLAALLGLLFAASSPAMAQSGSQMSTYQSTPFWLDGQTIPHVMLVLERDWKMFYPAYNNLADLDGDGALDIGFNPQVTYVGYFDSNSCYRYNRNGFNPNSSSDETGYFVRAGATTPQTQAEADAHAVARGIDSTNLNYPASAHGVCSVTVGDRSQGLGLWHGNWLNYAMTSRMDAIRKVLYGGKRTTDTATQTILELVRVPPNANVWGGEIYADNIWESYAPSSPWYDVEMFTGFNAPAPGAMHFWARADYFWQTPVYDTPTPTPSTTSSNQINTRKNSKPLFRFVSNVPSTNRHPFLKTPLRIWDWSGDHSSYNSIPSDGHLANSKNSAGNTLNNFMAGSVNVAWNFAARVEVCQSGNIGATEGCQAYGSSYKPVGLLQEYGESSRMYFGLMTGTVSHPSPYGIDSGTRYKGGVVRHHIRPFSEYVNNNGIIVRPGLINTIDVLEITGVAKTGYPSYADGSQAGNPLGEMVWEAVRYLGGGVKGLTHTAAFASTESTVTGVDDNPFTLTKEASWNPRPLVSDNVNDCPKPIILAISEVFPDHDGDDYPNLGDLNDAPRSPFANGSSSLVPTAGFSLDDYLEVITKTDKLSTTESGGKHFFYPEGSGGLCSARSLSGLSDIKGHCPSEPSLEGTYNLAAVAYYAHTHDFKLRAGENDDGTIKTKDVNIDFYAVGIAGNFPDITLTVDDTRSLTLMPIALTDDSDNYSPEGETDDAFRTLLNFFIEYWQTDDGHTYMDNGVAKIRKIPFKVKFRTNFEFTTYPCFVYGGNSNNWERDLFNAITITLLTEQSTPAQYREAEPMYINSGPFKTRNRTLYLNQRAQYRTAAASNPSVNPDSYFLETGGQKYYYAFKKVKGVPLDISTLDVVGVTVHSDSTGSGYGGSGQTGYTITGVNHPGAYLDVGLNRSDYPIYYSDSSCRPSMTVFVPNTSCGDESVPLDPAGSGLPGARWDYSANGMHTRPPGIDFTNHTSGSTYVYTNNGDCGYYHPPTLWSELLTPAECPYAGYSNSDSWTDPDLIAAYNPRPNAADVCGEFAAGYVRSGALKRHAVSNTEERELFNTSLMRYVQVRSFKFNTSADRPQDLPNPMWLAAKYGGFNDLNGNGVPDQDLEWKRGGKGVGADDPYNYFGVANMSELPEQLGKAFEAIANSVGTGTANASSVSQVLGGGVSVQTQYRTTYTSGSGDDAVKIKWGGTTYAFFLDKWGNFRADTNGNGKLDLVTSPKNPADWGLFHPGESAPSPLDYDLGPDGYEVGDLIVHMVAPSDTGLPSVYLCRDVYGNNNNHRMLPSDPGQYPPSGDNYEYPPNSACDPVSSLDAVEALWNSAQGLSDIPEASLNQRRLYTYYGTYKADGSGWSTGGVDISTYGFDTSAAAQLHPYMNQADNAETGDLIDFIRGKDFDKYRGRKALLPWDDAGAGNKVWRMGDVINSKPVLVGAPDNYYHRSYGDESYRDYFTDVQYSRRRQVAYFGSNDGIFHAVNMGFFGALKDGQAYYDKEPIEATAPIPSPNYEIGEEMWGFVPPSLLPHLQWLADKNYEHSYYVDLKPHVVDVKDHSGQWRTIMIVGLRLGGAPIELTNPGADISYTTPEFFAMDVTDPEAGPKLLWRFAHPNLGQPTAQPMVVRSGHDDRWYVVLPSGPAQLDSSGQPIFDNAGQLYAGRSTQHARVFVLDVITGQYVRGRDIDPSTAVGNDPLVAEEDNSFFNDTYATTAADTVTTAGGVTTWYNKTVYMGMTSVNASNYDSGAVYRLMMVDDLGNPTHPNDWKLKRFYKTDRPVTGAVVSSYDYPGNTWVLFGTGRVWGKDDMTPCGVASLPPVCVDSYEQYLYGIKEPRDSNGRLTFGEVPKDVDIVDVSDIIVFENGDLAPDPNATGFINYNALYKNMVARDPNYQPNVNGWKLKLETWKRDYANAEKDGTGEYVKDATTGMVLFTNPHPTVFELINTQVAVDTQFSANNRMYAVVSTYVPSDNVCEPLGMSYVMMFDITTGLPAPELVDYGGMDGDSVKVDTGSGMSTYRQSTGLKKVGAGISSQAWILVTEDGNLYGTTGFAGQRVYFKAPAGQTATSGFISWREVLDMGFKIENDEKLYEDIKK